MLRRKSLLLFATIALLTSCSKDSLVDSSIKAIEVETKKILTFNSFEEINEKVDFIKALKKEKEQLILDEMFNSADANPVDITMNPEITKELRDYAQLYHTKKLENIYDLRKTIGFTSIQSIADEINSLRATDPLKSEQLFYKYEKYLIKKQFDVHPKTNPHISEVLNLDAKITLNDEIIDYSLENTPNQRSYLQGVVEGTIVSNAYYAITWHAGYENTKLFIGRKITPFTKQASWINLGNGYFAYPSKFNVNEDTSKATLLNFSPFSYIRFKGSNNQYTSQVHTDGDSINSLSLNPSLTPSIETVKINSGIYETYTDIQWINPYLNLSGDVNWVNIFN